jgi:hypothetical protein
MIMTLDTKKDRAGEGQQQFTGLEFLPQLLVKTLFYKCEKIP